MTRLPILSTADTQMQTVWASAINPLLTNPVLNGITLKQVQLVTGSNVINHLLGRKLQGWVLTRINGVSAIYDTNDLNKTPQLTLELQSSASVTVDIYVY